MASAQLPILCLDTASTTLWVDILQQWPKAYSQTVAAEERAISHPIQSQRRHSSLLVPAIQERLDHHGLAIGDINTIAVNVGPGSFTGVRTAVVTARTLAQFSDCDVVPFDTLTLAAIDRLLQEPTPSTPPIFRLWLDARQGKAYTATLTFDTQNGSFVPRFIHPPTLEPVSLPTHNTSNLTQELWLVEPALIDSIASWLPPGSEPRPTLEPLKLDQVHTVSAMAHLLQHPTAPQPVHWTELTPLYLQQPSVTLSKNSSPGAKEASKNPASSRAVIFSEGE